MAGRRPAACHRGPGRGYELSASHHAVVGVAPHTLQLAAERGDIDTHHPLKDGPWLFRRTDLDRPAAKNLLSHVRTTQNTPRYLTPSNRRRRANLNMRGPRLTSRSQAKLRHRRPHVPVTGPRWSGPSGPASISLAQGLIRSRRDGFLAEVEYALAHPDT